MDHARSTITWDAIPDSTLAKSQLNKQGKHTFVYNFSERISFAEHGNLVAESSESHLTLNRAHRAHFSLLEIRKKKAGHFK